MTKGWTWGVMAVVLVGATAFLPERTENRNILTRDQVAMIVQDLILERRSDLTEDNPIKWTPDTSRNYARAMLPEYGWKHKDFACLNELWTRESNWRTKAENKSSGAYGIPQALPATKMARFGDDYRKNPKTQIKWGMLYINERYENPCTALRHHNLKNWY
jgi:hypothetical protein